MNKIVITAMAFLALTINRSCETDDINESTTSTNTLNASWSLVSIQGGFANVDYQFDENEIIWKFNTGTNQLSVINNNVSDVAYNGLGTGEYSFSTIEFDAILLLEINNESFGSYAIEEDNLTIDQNGSTSGNSDGFLLGFVKL